MQEVPAGSTGSGVVVDHAEGAALGIASNHADVGHWWSRFGTSMDDFRAGVAQRLQKEEEPAMTREEVAQMISKALEEDRKSRIFPSWQMCRAGPGQRYKSCWSGRFAGGMDRDST